MSAPDPSGGLGLEVVGHVSFDPAERWNGQYVDIFVVEADVGIPASENGYLVQRFIGCGGDYSAKLATIVGDFSRCCDREPGAEFDVVN